MNEPQYGWWLPPQISAHGDDIDLMINMIHWFMLALFVGWSAFIVFCLVRFRERPGHVAVYQPIEARFNRWLEIGVAVAEAAILVAFAMPVWAKVKTQFPTTEGNTVVIRVVGEQFKWLFHYPGRDGIFGRTGPEHYADDNPAGLDFDDDDGIDDITVRSMHIPVDTPVIARLVTKDVIHSFKIPVMRLTQDVIPGMEIPIWFEARTKGTYQIGCAQLCGLGHYEMKANFTVESKQDFQRWLDDEHSALGLD